MARDNELEHCKECWIDNKNGNGFCQFFNCQCHASNNSTMPKPNQPQQVEQIKQLLFGAYLATLNIENLDTGELEAGLSPEAAFEKQWGFIEPKIQTLIKNAHTEGKLEGSVKSLQEVVKSLQEVIDTMPHISMADLEERLLKTQRSKQ